MATGNEVLSTSSEEGSPFDISIIGAGPSGLFATYYAGFREMKTAIVDALPETGGQLSVLYPEKTIFDVPGYPEILARDLVNALLKQATRYNPTVLLGERVSDLKKGDDGFFTLTTEK